MNILGLHFGHDGGATIVSNGEVRSYVARERITRIKHALGIDMKTIELALELANIEAHSLDCVAVSSTQCVELVIDDPSRFDIRYSGTDFFGRPMPTVYAGLDHTAIVAGHSCTLLDYLYDEPTAMTHVGENYRKTFPRYQAIRRDQICFVPWIDQFLDEAALRTPVGLNQLDLVAPEISDRYRYGFHLPIRVRLDDLEIPGYAIHHHLAHAASSYYMSQFEEAAIFTHDGFGFSAGYHSGMFYLGRDEAIYPLGCHNLIVGYLYETVANDLGLGVGGASGKLMGLAPYGQPRFFDSRFVGNIHDFRSTFPNLPRSWINHCLRIAEGLGYETSALGDHEKATDPVNADIASSTQRVLETTRLAAVRALRKQLRNARIEVTDLCMSGGTALNCPSNSEIANSGCFERTFIEPACDDSGIAIGCALAAYHTILGHPRRFARPSPYLGRVYTERDVDSAVAAAGAAVTATFCDDAAIAAAEDLQTNRIVGWFEGASECGPRALGHRSLLADPRDPANWSRVNRIKQRESWRPLAPAVLESAAAEWYQGLPLPSPYMLFNAKVRSHLLPAVTHVDRSARIQTVDPSCGQFYRLLEAFSSLTEVPVVLNTSLNGHDEPIVETPADAIQLLLEQDIDVLFLQGRRVERSATAARTSI